MTRSGDLIKLMAMAPSSQIQTCTHVILWVASVHSLSSGSSLMNLGSAWGFIACQLKEDCNIANVRALQWKQSSHWTGWPTSVLVQE